MSEFLLLILGGAGFLALYAYAGYPLALVAAAKVRSRNVEAPTPLEWPRISITVPAYNEGGQIRDTIESLLRLDYPEDRRQILVVSDASSDGTDDIVRQYADRGVQLHRMPERVGKTAAENSVSSLLTGDIVVNTDASIRIHSGALKPLVRCLEDPTVGVASGRDISVSRVEAMEADRNLGESGYVGYEMWMRRLETRVDGIVGASGCLYAIRKKLHDIPVPAGLSRDFAAALKAREHDLRAVSVDDAVAYVPRAPSLRAEYRRKVRTMARGMQTLAYKRHLLNPVRYGWFAWMLWSHKVCRWLLPWSAAVGLVSLALLSISAPWARWLLVPALAGLAAGAVGWAWPEERRLPRLLAVPAYALAGNVAAIHASVRAVTGGRSQVWEPTRRATPVEG